MRVLFSAVPLHGHVFPLLPLARACRERGEDVAMLTAGAAAPILRPEGIPVLTAGPAVPEIRTAVLGATGVDIDTDPLTVEAEAEFFSCRIDLGFEDSLLVADAWKPDLIVSEMYDCVGPLIAAVLDIPLARVGIGPAILEYKREEYVRRLAPRYASRGAELRPERWYLDTCPPSLQRKDWTRPEGWAPLRPEAHRSPGAPSLPHVESLPAGPPGGRPRVLVTFGTLFSYEPAVMDPLVDELLSQGVDLRVTLGPGAQESDFATRGDRVEFTAFAPLSELLRGVNAVVTHGGSGTVLGALAAGLPMVVVPLGADQPLQAAQVAGCGAGISFPLGEAPPHDVAEAVVRVLDESGYRRAARKAADEIAATPAPDEVAKRLAEEISVS